jgi:hypothetical protein
MIGCVRPVHRVSGSSAANFPFGSSLLHIRRRRNTAMLLNQVTLQGTRYTVRASASQKSDSGVADCRKQRVGEVDVNAVAGYLKA